MRLNKISLACLVLGGSALLTACGGGGSAPPTPVASAATVAAINPTSGAAIVTAVLNQTFTFPAVAALGTTAATTLGLGGTGTAPTFNIASGGLSATGNMSFGSCIFTITTSAFSASHALAVGNSVTVNPCTLNLATAGVPADGVQTTVATSFVLGAVPSEVIQLVGVSVATDGTVSVGGVPIAIVPVVIPSGAGG